MLTLERPSLKKQVLRQRRLYGEVLSQNQQNKKSHKNVFMNHDLYENDFSNP